MSTQELNFVQQKLVKYMSDQHCQISYTLGFFQTSQNLRFCGTQELKVNWINLGNVFYHPPFDLSFFCRFFKNQKKKKKEREKKKDSTYRRNMNTFQGWDIHLCTVLVFVEDSTCQ